MRISDVFTMGGNFGYGDGSYEGYRCYGDYGGDCFSGSRPFEAPIQVKAPDLRKENGNKGAY
jgi:hypothetical protein